MRGKNRDFSFCTKKATRVIKAFNNLGKLQEPAAFEKWFGVIVANTAKNALAKKNPVLFTDVAVDDEGEEFTYDVED